MPPVADHAVTAAAPDGVPVIRAPRILHLATWQSLGGIAVWLLEMLRRVPRDRWEMDLAYNRRRTPALIAAAEQTGARVLACPLNPLIWGFVRRLRRIVRAGQYDLLHSHLDGYNGLAVLAARGLGIPVICTFHSTSLEPRVWWTRLFPFRQLRAILLHALVRYALRHARLITAVSQAALGEVLRRGPWPGHPPRVLPLGVPSPPPLSDAERRALRAGWGVPADAPLVVHVGRFTAEKNHHDVLKVFRQVRQTLPQAHLLLLGEGPLENSIRLTIARHGLASAVHMPGHQPQAGAMIQACDVMLFPSQYEGLPLAVLEAQAAGVPVVASRVPGILEAVEADHGALLHEVHDVSGMANSVLTILQAPEVAQRLAAAGRRHHALHFTPEAAVRALTEVYQACLSRRQPPLPHPETSL